MKARTFTFRRRGLLVHRAYAGVNRRQSPDNVRRGPNDHDSRSERRDEFWRKIASAEAHLRGAYKDRELYFDTGVTFGDDGHFVSGVYRLDEQGNCFIEGTEIPSHDSESAEAKDDIGRRLGISNCPGCKHNLWWKKAKNPGVFISGSQGIINVMPLCNECFTALSEAKKLKVAVEYLENYIRTNRKLFRRKSELNQYRHDLNSVRQRMNAAQA